MLLHIHKAYMKLITFSYRLDPVLTFQILPKVRGYLLAAIGIRAVQ